MINTLKVNTAIIRSHLLVGLSRSCIHLTSILSSSVLAVTEGYEEFALCYWVLGD